MKEYLFTTNDLSQPKEVQGEYAIGILLYRLLVLNPGTNPLHPRMGVGIHNYRFTREEDLYKLQNKIDDQISKYLSDNGSYNCVVKLDLKKNNVLVIKAVINDSSFIYDTEKILNDPIIITPTE